MQRTLNGMYRFLVVAALVLQPWLSAEAQTESGRLVNGQSFREYSTIDKLGRKIRFYVSETQLPGNELPLVVYIQGTGCSSQFTRRNGQVHMGVHGLVYEALRGRARVAVVDKPGVEPFDDPGEQPMQESCRPEFFYEHTLARWSEAIAAAIQSAQTLLGVDDSTTLVLGHSEGGMVAVRVSNILSSVTHAASLAGGGPNHMYVLAEYVRRRGLDPQKFVYDCWREVQADPQSTTKFCLDHSFRHWSGFYRTSLIEECLKSTAKLYLMHGSADEQNFVGGFDMMRAELAAQGRSAVFERLEGAGHSLDLPSQVTPEGLLAAFERLASWFLDDLVEFAPTAVSADQ